jgi:hypothetical protein
MAKVGDGTPGPGRPKGSQNKTTAILKDAILQAAQNAGEGDMVEYLTRQAQLNPGPFMSLLGKVLPMQLTGEDGGAIEVIARIERRIVKAQ